MSTIKATNWQPAAGGTAVDIGDGLIKKYLTFGNDTIIDESSGVSSLTDSATGQYIVNHSGDMATASVYPFQYTSQAGFAGGFLGGGVYTVSALSIQAINEGGTSVDKPVNCVSIHGVLA